MMPFKGQLREHAGASGPVTVAVVVLPPSAGAAGSGGLRSWFGVHRRVRPYRARAIRDLGPEERQLPGHWQDFVCAQLANVGMTIYR
ncbi:MAG: hypothetical protein ACR2LJ_07175 [Acidimicrobiales bacterium]